MNLTIAQFNCIPYDQVFATGFMVDSTKGLKINNDGRLLRWVAKKGRADDWAIYYADYTKTIEWIKEHGEKVHGKLSIKRCVACTDQVLEIYRK